MTGGLGGSQDPQDPPLATPMIFGFFQHRGPHIQRMISTTKLPVRTGYHVKLWTIYRCLASQKSQLELVHPDDTRKWSGSWTNSAERYHCSILFAELFQLSLVQIFLVLHDYIRSQITASLTRALARKVGEGGRLPWIRNRLKFQMIQQ